ncbi:50S ribosomal protein L11 methyltransferase [Sutterella sp.]|uniref:50S ribosomal protein L11 methyltransferase n=1 Tax=Sutterella sp. TaxID=1981025 RepID=UPI0026E07919|nr:50S ribosomal protein L11 methyltransferase [Sutterella sp.]MDO5531846.1 50S ribosomal protein L11 methyltransferase [Sutterella sp.]
MREYRILADQRSAEELSDLLLDAGVLSAALEDADADSTDEQPLYGEPGLEPQTQAWPRSIISILTADGFDFQGALAAAVAQAGCDAPELLETSDVEDQDWVRITQAQFQPAHVSPRLWIVPSWSEPPEPDALIMRLDPGVAFGTGSHPTTRLCLNWLDENLHAHDSVLDYGCGTGILAIGAKMLGAGRVTGTDIDPQAVEAARDNASTNGAQADFHLPDAMPEGRFSVVVANILANPLKLLAPALLGRVAPGGRLVLSGVLARQADEVIAAYAAADPTLPLSVWREDSGWVCLAGSRQN